MNETLTSIGTSEMHLRFLQAMLISSDRDFFTLEWSKRWKGCSVGCSNAGPILNCHWEEGAELYAKDIQHPWS